MVEKGSSGFPFFMSIQSAVSAGCPWRNPDWYLVVYFLDKDAVSEDRLLLGLQNLAYLCVIFERFISSIYLVYGCFLLLINE